MDLSLTQHRPMLRPSQGHMIAIHDQGSQHINIHIHININLVSSEQPIENVRFVSAITCN